MTTAFDTDTKNIRLSVSHPRILVEFLKEQGIDERQVLVGTSINAHLLESEHGQLTYEQYLELIQRAIDLTKNPQIGLDFGSRLKATSMGLLGLGFLSCSTFIEAMYLLRQIVSVTNPAVRFNVSEGNDYLCIGIEEAHSWYDYSDFMVDVAIAFINNVVALYDQSFCSFIKYDLKREKSENEIYIRQFLEGPIRFHTKANRVFIPSEFAKRPLPLESSLALKQSMIYINNQRKALQNEYSLVVEPVKHIISASPGRIPSLQEVADQLHMSPRTLNRRFKSIGTSFKEVSGDVRKKLAIDCLSNNNKTIEQIAYKMGYSSPANFANAFRRWTGCSPSEYREKSLKKSRKL